MFKGFVLFRMRCVVLYVVFCGVYCLACLLTLACDSRDDVRNQEELYQVSFVLFFFSFAF